VCPYYLDGEQLTRTSCGELAFYTLTPPEMGGANALQHTTGCALRRTLALQECLALVQFSRSTEATRRGYPAGVSEN
jgi:hypothetical protein